jgi:methylmalonyl-CoA mutase N-terminal domain/subunit
VLAEESGVARTVDPLAGSWYVEQLTDEIENRARAYLERIDAMGGAARAVEYMQEEIHQAAYRHQLEVEAGSRTVVGLNAYQEDDRAAPAPQPDYSALEARDPAAVQAVLGAVVDAARSGENLMPRLVRAVKARATLGEISDALRGEWGTFDGA